MKAAINGSRTPTEHPAVPVTPEQQAVESAAAVTAGAGAIHVHVREADGRESLTPRDVSRAMEAIRAACPGTPVGVSTGAWIVPDVDRRLSLIRGWDVLPDFASVNVHEEGALRVMKLLLDKGVGVEAGVWTGRAAQMLLDSGLVDQCLRILIEPAEEPGDAVANSSGIERLVNETGHPILLHGFDASAWMFVKLAAERGYDARIGFEDTLVLPDGTPAPGNAELVAAALRITAAASGH